VAPAFFVSSGTKRLDVLFIYLTHNANDGGRSPCQPRMSIDYGPMFGGGQPVVVYTVLLKLAAELQKRAERLERSNESLRS
jgi:hypothetical protein